VAVPRLDVPVNGVRKKRHASSLREGDRLLRETGKREEENGIVAVSGTLELLNLRGANGTRIVLDLSDSVTGYDVNTTVSSTARKPDLSELKDLTHVPGRQLLGIPPVSEQDLAAMARRFEWDKHGHYITDDLGLSSVAELLELDAIQTWAKRSKADWTLNAVPGGWKKDPDAVVCGH
jgi:hypothetical protein